MKKKILNILLLVVVAFSFSTVLVGCKNKDNNTNDTINSIQLSYIKNLSINVDSSMAFGIKKEINESTNSLSLNNDLVSIKPLVDDKSDSHNNTHTRKYYLYSTTQTYQNGTVEYADNTIEKVTFVKNTEVEENVYDSKGNLIDSNRIITQEEIPAQINKLYVSDKYVFMQFVAMVEESGKYKYYDDNGQIGEEFVALRPEVLEYNEDGISEFDKKDYYSSSLVESFVVDNETGHIYKINDFNIKEICDVDIVIDSENNYYKMSINENNELIFIDVLPNKDVTIKNILTDKYGYTFVYNTHIDTKNMDSKIIYFTDKTYGISKDREVFTFEYTSGTLIYSLKKIFVNGIECDIESNKIILDLEKIRKDHSEISIIGMYKEYEIKDFNTYTLQGIEGVEDSIYVKSSDASISFYWFDNYNSIIAIKDNYLFKKDVNIDESLGKNIVYTISDFEKILDVEVFNYNSDYYMNIGDDKLKIKNVYYSTSLEGTIYYQLTRENGELILKVLQNKEYSQNVYIFQPINK